MSPALKYWDATTSTWKLGAVGLPSGQVWQQVIGDGVATSFTVTHGFGTRSVYVSVYRNSPPYEEVEADVEHTDTSSVTVRTYPTVPAVSEFIAVVASAGTQATLNITMDTWHTVGVAGEPAANPPWTATLRFRKDPTGRVWIYGSAQSGASGTSVFTLPVGYRPPSAVLTHSLQTNDVGGTYVQIGTAGAVTVSYNQAVAYLDLSFDTESVLQTASVAAQPLDAWHVVGASGEPTLQSPFSISGEALAFRKYPDGRVRLRGFATGTVGANVAALAFTLPVGYRPPAYRRFTVSTVAGGNVTQWGRVYVDVNGSVFIENNNSSSYWDFASVEFDTESVAAYASGIIGPSRVTALPANPVDGQECYFVVDATNGVLWHLRFNAGSASAYKWEFVGGSPLSSRVTTSENYANAALGDLTTIGPQVTLPLAGDYRCDWGARIQFNVAGAAEGFVWLFALAGGGTNTSYAASMIPTAQYGGGTAANNALVAGNPAGGLLKLRYSTQASLSFSFSQRWLEATPVRVG